MSSFFIFGLFTAILWTA